MHGVEYMWKDKNELKVLLLDIFAFSSTFSGLQEKYYHLKYFSSQNMHGLEHVRKTLWFSNISLSSFKGPNMDKND